MANTKITALTAANSVATTDLIPVVLDPSGTPVNRKATVAQVIATVQRLGTAVFTVEGAVTTGTGVLRIYNKSGVTRTIAKVWAVANTAPTGANLIVDIHLDGTTIHSTQSNRATIADGQNYDDTSTIEVASWADGSYLTMDRDQVGSTVAGSDLVVGIEYSY